MTLYALIGTALLPFVVFWIGALTMRRLTGQREVARRLVDKLPARRDQTPLNQRFLGYDRAAVQRHWGALAIDPPLLRSERSALLLDLIFPLLYGAALVASLLLCRRWLQPPFDCGWLLLPVAIGVLADWTENLVQLKQIRRFQEAEAAPEALEDGWIRVASVATQVKLLFLGGSALILLILVLVLLFRMLAK
jgi:hypothetical protein